MFSWSPEGPGGEVSTPARQLRRNDPAHGHIFGPVHGAGNPVIPTLWLLTLLAPANFLASKAIWYPAARQRCGCDREGRSSQTLGNRKDILSSVPSAFLSLHWEQPAPPRTAGQSLSA